MRRFKIRNWERFQHYKDRCPPWIKLHWELLQSRDWVMLDDASRVLAVACMLVASRNNGEVPDDADYLKRVAYLNQVPDFEPLIKYGFLAVIADDSACKRKQANVTTETEEETEEEEEEEEDCSEPPDPPAASEPPVMSIPLIKRDGSFPVMRSDIDEWQETFPGVDVEATIRIIRQWNIDNPTRRKTKGGIRKHISSWLGREQDKGGGKSPAKPKVDFKALAKKYENQGK